MARLLRIGTRGSALARAQAEQVAQLLRARDGGLEVQIEVISVSGDAGGGSGAIGDKSRWVDAIEQALQAGRVDLAVHSAKDVPGELGAGLALVGAPPRGDARDVLCGAGGLEALPPGALVGTSSVRRASQLLARREDLRVVALQGNVDTRLRRLADGDFDAIVLARAGLVRLGRESEAGVALSLEQCVPAPGQGILALEARADDDATLTAAGGISDPLTVAALAAERALVRALDASCRTPVGAHARVLDGDRGGDRAIELSAYVGLPDGTQWARDVRVGLISAPSTLGRQVGDRLLACGARELLAQAEEMLA